MLRSALIVLAALFACTASAQDTTAQRLRSNLVGLGRAPNDAYQDSLNALVKEDLRSLLDVEGGLRVPMDSLPITRVDAPDGTFRLVTWNLPRQDGSHLYEGFLLHMDGRVQRLYELRDMTLKIPSPEVPELGPDRWYGALYYEVVPVTRGDQTYYTLLGWKGYSRAETRKVIEVLSFRNGKPRFGAPLFGKGKLKRMRKVFGFSSQATMVLRWDANMEGILLDHLSPSRADMEGEWSFYGPDMVQDAYFWHKGEWWYGPDMDVRSPAGK